ncbi:MAG: PilZ domain-containing protein [Candidatus Omnitrophica bacterium]|nr:PilZ domain-containing protein [Candidatus Omnitrophota bacterium]
MITEKRREHRFHAQVPIRIIYQKKEINSTTENISRLGTYILVRQPLEAGSSVDIVLDIPDYLKNGLSSGQVHCKGSVFRCNYLHKTEETTYYGVGIFFTVFLEDTDRQRLSDFIDYLAQQEDKEIREGLLRRKEKQLQLQEQSSESKDKKQDTFQKETLRLLYLILEQLHDIQKILRTKQTQ